VTALRRSAIFEATVSVGEPPISSRSVASSVIRRMARVSVTVSDHTPPGGAGHGQRPYASRRVPVTVSDRTPPGAREASALYRAGVKPWLRVCGVMFAVGWGANQFSSLLLAYERHRGVSEGTADALFGIYALGLIPALLALGPISDARGRRAITYGAGALSGVATCALMAGEHSLAMLFLGRLLAGVASGAAFAAGTAWVKELSVAPHDPAADAQAGARRAAIALSAGFGLGPLVAGLLAQWAPHPLLVAYLPHLAVVALTLAWAGPAARAPETVSPAQAGSRRRSVLVASAATWRFRRVVTPSAPWVFLAPSVAFAVLPTTLAADLGGFRIGFAALTAALTLGVGVLVQPLARRIDRTSPGRGLIAGLTATFAALAIGALAATLGSWPLALPADVLFGAGYGLCLVSGLLEVQRLAAPDELASLTAIFYALTYVGFAAPLAIAELDHVLDPPVVLLAGAGLAGLVLAWVGFASARARRPAPSTV
jgi:Major Facilitator Superfamily